VPVGQAQGLGHLLGGGTAQHLVADDHRGQIRSGDLRGLGQCLIGDAKFRDQQSRQNLPTLTSKFAIS
jgi:hypothetical protein